MTATTRTVGDYERLRAVALGAEPVCGHDLGIIRHHGLAAWIKAPPAAPNAQYHKWQTAPSGISSVSPAPTELAQLVAGIIITLATEVTHG